jgi:hypothetical protein
MFTTPDQLAKVVTVRGSHILRLADIPTVLGYAEVGTNNNPCQRAELQGAPQFAGLVGPMWDSEMLRYEDVQTYSDLST